MNQDNSSAPHIFDMQKRQAKFSRAEHRLVLKSEKHFLWNYIAKEFCERLAAVKRKFDNILIIGPMRHYANDFIETGDNAINTDANVIIASQDIIEDQWPYASEQFDLIITGATLDSVNDLPGALIQIRRSLVPDGLLVASIFGSGSLPCLKSVMMSADGDAVRPHIHPQIDIRTMADLLVRTGYKLPVADRDTLKIRYSDLFKLVNDIRDMGLGNSLNQVVPHINKAALYKAFEKWDNLLESDNKVSETIELIHFNGWASSPDQPKPAKRGSANISLVEVLKPQTDK